MANSPQSSADQNAAVDFRAPPPSPIASGRRSSFANDDVLTDFLEHSLRVPDLILPDRVFPRQKSIESPPAIDFRSIESPENGDSTVATILDSIAQIGCFQLVNHGISREQIRSATAAGAGIFNLPPEKKVTVSTSPEKPYGFEECQGETDREMSEEFVWSRDGGLKREMDGIWPLGYSNFSEKMERLLVDVEKVAGKVLLALEAHYLRKPQCGNGTTQRQDFAGPICFLYKHCQRSPGGGSSDQWVSSLRYDVIRMLIRGSDYSHALCLHVCDIGSSEFHVYSKRGWVSFYPDPDALVITIGDQIQAWSGGRYKHVIGRPVLKGEDGECVSMAFLYSPPSTRSNFKPNLEKTVSLGQQAVVALVFALVYHLLIYIFKQ